MAGLVAVYGDCCTTSVLLRIVYYTLIKVLRSAFIKSFTRRKDFYFVGEKYRIDNGSAFLEL